MKKRRGDDFKVGDDHYEVKTGDAELTPRQEREKRRHDKYEDES